MLFLSPRSFFPSAITIRRRGKIVIVMLHVLFCPYEGKKKKLIKAKKSTKKMFFPSLPSGSFHLAVQLLGGRTRFTKKFSFFSSQISEARRKDDLRPSSVKSHPSAAAAASSIAAPIEGTGAALSIAAPIEGNGAFSDMASLLNKTSPLSCPCCATPSPSLSHDRCSSI